MHDRGPDWHIWVQPPRRKLDMGNKNRVPNLQRPLKPVLNSPARARSDGTGFRMPAEF